MPLDLHIHDPTVYDTLRDELQAKAIEHGRMEVMLQSQQREHAFVLQQLAQMRGMGDCEQQLLELSSQLAAVHARVATLEEALSELQLPVP